MREEIIVILVVFFLLVTVLCYCMCVIAGKAEDDAEKARRNYQKELKKKEGENNEH